MNKYTKPIMVNLYFVTQIKKDKIIRKILKMS